MNSGQHFDYIIVGQGLAGTCLAHTLRGKFGCDVFVIDRDSGRKCSRIAAGTFNPISFRTLSMVWKADILLPYLREYYGEFSEFLSVKLLEFRPVFRLLRNDGQRTEWLQKCQMPQVSAFMESKIEKEVSGIRSEFGFGVVKQSGNLDTTSLLQSFRKILWGEGKLMEETFDHRFLEFSENAVEYKGRKARGIVFCEGHEYTHNPYFSYLPLRPTNGEAMTISCPGLELPGIIHNRINIVPLASGQFWVGSSFRRSGQGTDKDGFEYVRQLTDQTLSVPYEITGKFSGIRPAVVDRRPIIGRHKDSDRVFIFNGMGSRAVMLAPFFSMEMALLMTEEKQPDKEVDIRRFSESV